jgi:hypothetical protein
MQCLLPIPRRNLPKSSDDLFQIAALFFKLGNDAPNFGLGMGTARKAYHGLGRLFFLALGPGVVRGPSSGPAIAPLLVSGRANPVRNFH